MRDTNGIVTKLGTRVKEIDGVISELPFLTKNKLG
jgi:hypothetical protein